MSGIHPEHAHRQIPAITYALATAPDIQEDLKRLSSFFTEPYETFGLEDKVFGLKELEGYRMNNSRKDIAEDLDVKSRYGIEKNKTAKVSVGYAFRGYDGKDFPKHKFDGLLGKVTNDYITEIRKRTGSLATVETHGDQMRNGGLIGGRIGGRATVETHGYQIGNGGRKGGLAAAKATGKHVWSDEEIADIFNFREDSFNHSSKFNPNSPNWNDTTSKMNEKHNKNWSTKQITMAYENNK